MVSRRRALGAATIIATPHAFLGPSAIDGRVRHGHPRDLREESGFPVSPAMLAIVMGQQVEQQLMTSLIKTGGNPMGFVDRPLSVVFAAATFLICGPSLYALDSRSLRRGST